MRLALLALFVLALDIQRHFQWLQWLHSWRVNVCIWVHSYGPRLPMQLAAEHPLQNCNANGLPAMFEDVPLHEQSERFLLYLPCQFDKTPLNSSRPSCMPHCVPCEKKKVSSGMTISIPQLIRYRHIWYIYIYLYAYILPDMQSR